MKKFITFAKNYWQFLITILIGIFAVSSAVFSRNFGSTVPLFSRKIELANFTSAEITIIVWGIFIAIFLFADMIKTLRSGRYGVDILAITAIIACILVGQTWAALVIVLMLTGGETLEDFAAGRAKRELSALLKRAPDVAHLVEKSGEIREIKVGEVKVGDVLLVRAREVVPVDGKLIQAAAEFDESSLTGESLPVAKKPGDAVMSGSLNGSSSAQIQTTAISEDSQYAKIIKLVREAESQPAPFVRLADRYAVPFTVISYLIAGVAWFASKDPTRFAEVLVVASPCPLILAAPIALISGMSVASKNGIIVKNGSVLEKFREARAIALVKTGTLSKGEVEISEVQVSSDKFREKVLIRLAASAESGSSHVLATSLLAFAKNEKIALSPAKNLREIAGSGIYATVDSRKILVGQIDFLRQNKIANLPENDKLTSMFVAVDGAFAGRIIFADKLRPESPKTVKKLKKLGFREIVMLTGDNRITAGAIAKKIGLDFRAELLPEDKVREIKKLKKSYGVVAMVGDGINDAPVLASSDVGIAMGARGNTAASESADAVIMLDDLSRVALLREIAHRTINVALQSVWTGIILCIILMLIAAFGVIPAIIGAGLQELIDVTVILNALRAHSVKTQTSRA
jgi:heavy metal translocating P-type ATPase